MFKHSHTCYPKGEVSDHVLLKYVSYIVRKCLTPFGYLSACKKFPLGDI